MSQRFYLFYSGYTLCAPMRYYNQLMVSEIIEQSNNLSLKEYSNVEVAELESLKLESNTHIETVISIANELKQDVKEKPVSFETYIDWKKNVISIFEENFPMTKIEHYYFLFGRRLSDVIVNIHTLTKLVSVIKFGENGDRIIKKIDKLLKDMGVVLEKQP